MGLWDRQDQARGQEREGRTQQGSASILGSWSESALVRKSQPGGHSLPASLVVQPTMEDGFPGEIPTGPAFTEPPVQSITGKTQPPTSLAPQLQVPLGT